MSNDMVVHQQQPMIPYADMERMATVIAQSGLFGVKNPTQALALMLLSQAEGLHPVMAARDYHVIQGRPTLKSDTMLARFQAAGGKVEWHDYTDTAVSGTFSHPSGGKIKVEWTLEMAKRAKLTGKEVWTQYPRAMLRARVISEGIRTVFPGVLAGMYTPEEVRDMVEVKGEAETSGPNPIEPPPPVAPQDFDAEIEAIKNKVELRKWLQDTKRDYGWKKDDPVCASVTAACAERAAAIDDELARAKIAATQTADEFEAALGPVPDVE